MNVKKFSDWLSEEAEKSKQAPIEIISSVTATRNLAEALMQKEGFTDDEKLCFFILKESNTALYEWDTLNEGLISKLKEVGAKALKGGKDYIKDVKDTIGKDIKGLPDFFKALASGVKNLGVHIYEFFKAILKKMFGAPYDWVKAALGGNFTKFENDVKDKAKKEGTKIKDESIGVKDIVVGIPKLLSPTKIKEDVEKAILKADTEKIPDEELALVEESINVSILTALTEAVKIHTAEEIREGFSKISESDYTDETINEGHFKIPFVTSLTNILEKMPPFSWLSSLAKTFTENANEYLNQFSELMAKKGAIKKATTFTVIGSLVGLGLEFFAKTQAKSAIGFLFPPLHAALLTLGGVATAICVVHIASSVIDGLKDDVHDIDTAAASIAH